MRQRIVIPGLVRFAASVRARLAAGIAAASAARFRFDVRRQVEAVARSLERLGARPEHLPVPTREAWRFLAGLDLDALPAPREDAPARPSRPARIAGAARLLETLPATLWRDLDRLGPGTPDRARLDALLAARRGELEHALDGGACPAGPARFLAGWLRFLAHPGRLDAHLAALHRARDAVRSARGAPAGLEVHLVHFGSLWRAQTRDGRLVIRASEGFLSAPAPAWEDLVETCAGRASPPRRVRLRALAESAAFVEVTQELELLSGPPPSPRGRVHDLAESFRRVNEALFGGRMEVPALGWTPAPVRGRVGSWWPARDLVLLSSILDDPAVPAFVVDAVMHHELLHKKHGASFGGGRRHVHTRAFRAEERSNPRFAEADAFLKGL